MYDSYIYLALGILARMFIPWLVLLYKNEQSDSPVQLNFEWRFLRGQALASAIVFIALPLLIGDLQAIADLDFQAAFLSGYGAASIGRFLDKSVTEE